MSRAFYAWSKTAANNAAASSAINLRDNQSPSVVKTNLREVMAELASWRDDTNGSLITTGTATAYAISSNQDISGENATPDGFEVTAVIHVMNGATPMLTVDDQDAAPITYKTGFAPDGGMMEAGSIQRFRWVAADSEWRLMHVVSRDATKVGASFDYWGSILPAGYVWANKKTIGNASSNATGRANADCAALFAVLWDAIASDELAIFDSSGSSTTRGANAAADFAANKQIETPDRRDRTSIGKGTMGGASAAGRVLNTAPVSIDTSKIGTSGGADRDTLTAARIPANIPNSASSSAVVSGAPSRALPAIRWSSAPVSGRANRSAAYCRGRLHDGNDQRERRRRA